jgi:serine phosphatase RsbU (regulator of sigma subunit)
MSEPVQKSESVLPAFQRALLQSERYRTLGVLIFTGVFGVVLAARAFRFGPAFSKWGILAAFLFIVFEFIRLRIVDHALKTERDLPKPTWIINTVLEMSIPAFGIMFLANPYVPSELRPLATAWILAYFPFIILSTLRLDAWLCRAGGIAASIGYLLAASYQGWRISFESEPAVSAIQTAVLINAAILLASGIIAGMVASEIRKYVQAALREAETRHKLQQVEHDLEIARSIQRSLLPRVRPTIDGFEIAGWSQAADETGGDYFDWKELPDGKLAVTLADVTGHGIGPALLASVCRAYARASFDAQNDLQTTLSQINKALKADLIPGRFATFVAAICRAGKDQVELLSAGHGPLFVYNSATRTVREIAAQAIPLGIVPELTSAPPEVLDLQSGDMVLLITDGFFEWENNQGEDFGTKRLADVICASSHLPPEEVIAALYSAAVTFANGAKQQDDLTAVVIKRT